MSKLTVDIPQSAIDEAAGKQLDTALKKVAKLEKENRNLRTQVEEAKEAVRINKELRLYVEDIFETYEDPW